MVRVLTGLWLLLALILVAVYRSNLKAMLILPKLNLPFDSVEELTRTSIPVWVSQSSLLHGAALVKPKTYIVLLHVCSVAKCKASRVTSNGSYFYGCSQEM